MKRCAAHAVSGLLVLLLAAATLGACTELGEGFLQSTGAVTVPDVEDAEPADSTTVPDATDDISADQVGVPDTAGDGTLVSDEGPDVVAPTVTWAEHIKPLFKQTGCSASFCHGTSKAGGLSVADPAALLQGGKHGAAVVPCAPGEGTIIDKFKTKPSFGKKMPLGGVTYTDAQRQLVIDWIASGADQPGGCP
jgi:hypothetical protein